MVHSARSLGSAALNMCNVAEGGLDAYWEGGEFLSCPCSSEGVCAVRWLSAADLEVKMW